MVFSSISFIFFILPCFLVFDWIFRFIEARKNKKKSIYIQNFSQRNFILLFISLVFYLFGDVFNLPLLVFLGFFNYIAGNIIYKYNKKYLLILFIVINISILFYCKYFFWLLGLIIGQKIVSPPLPLGISFFTFHAISYLVDIWRKDIKPAQSVLDFTTYFCMFPHLVAGPIVRFIQVRNEITQRGPDFELFSFGIFRFIVGLNKKVLIANSVAPLADHAFELAALDHLTFIDAWLGIVAYAVQIYFDFSGYSDMAIGLAAMAGFRFEENFLRPYASLNMRDFWRRWHISLSAWLRDYVYIPLGGSRCSVLRTCINLFIVFFLCGLWHGANLTFVVWGVWHGFFLIIERIKPVKKYLENLPTIVCNTYVLIVVLFGWCFFRSESLSIAFNYISILLFPSFQEPILSEYYSFSAKVTFFALLLCLAPQKLVQLPTSHKCNNFSAIKYFLHVFLSIISVSILMTSARNPFIYFNF